MGVGEAGVQFIYMQSMKFRFINAVFGYISTFLGLLLLLAFSIGTYPDPSSIEALIIALLAFTVPAVVSFLALTRNEIVCYIFKKLSQPKFMSLINIGRILRLIIVIISFTFLIVGIATFVIFNVGLNLMISGFILIFLSFPLIGAFSDLLTPTGLIKIIFGQLFLSLDNFVARQRWLRLVSELIEKALRIANIKVHKSKLVFYFNMEILKGRNIYGNLKEIEAWFLDEKNFSFDTINEIVPEKEFEVYERNLVLRQTIKNPIVLNWIIILILVAVLWIFNPTSVMEFLSRYIP